MADNVLLSPNKKRGKKERVVRQEHENLKSPHGFGTCSRQGGRKREKVVIVGKGGFRSGDIRQEHYLQQKG